MKKLFFTLKFLLVFVVLSVGQVDTVQPKIFCKQNLFIDYQYSSNCGNFINTWQLIDSVSDNQTPANQIKIGIRKACVGSGFPINSDSLFYTDTEIGPITVEVWAMDLAGNADTCIISLLLKWYSSCDPYYTMKTHTPTGKGIHNPNLILEVRHCLRGTFKQKLSIKSNGDYFTLGWILKTVGYDLAISASKDTNCLNGVTTADILLIQKHILGISPLDSPWKIIAADANQDGQVTSADILVLRKLILGIESQLPNGKSWRFIPASYKFPNAANPFQPMFPEKLEYPPDYGKIPNKFEFIGVKIGDVNNSAKPDQ